IGRLVAAQHSKHQILVRAVAERARNGNRPDDALAIAGHELLARVQAQDQAAAEEGISYPSVGAWAFHTLWEGQAGPGTQPDQLASVAAAAAIRAGIDAEITVPVVDGIVHLPTLGAAVAAGPTAVVRTKAAEIHSGGSCVAARSGAPGWEQ